MIHETQHEQCLVHTGKLPWIQSFLQCETDHAMTPTDAKCVAKSDMQHMNVGQSSDLSVMSGGNYMAMTAKRNSDSDKVEFEVHLTIPGKACGSQKDGCSSDCTIVTVLRLFNTF